MKAAAAGKEEVCFILLESGAEPLLKDRRKLTADRYAEITVKELNLHLRLRDWIQNHAQADW